ncbi:peptidase domain-containing ABC transporter [Paenibacillus sp. YPG26]|uniref:peptidase domain-containing ABC transporter n=1 Tax=Paenibacillus sp. YPG26 TaxID=2878915 RepID=UPI00203AB67E|nr:peptidase domain-containing ABC transporter [Paenibacillus sp. YPG26]USB33644.1 peptidase domain-containing ABC transporter [Paenibacillus sp. YPG26]
MKNRIRMVGQLHQTECGYCCLAMISGYHGLHVTLRELREIGNTGRDGLSLLDIMEICDKLNLEARTYEIEATDTANFGLPCIAFWEEKHFVVIEKFDKKGVWIYDPAGLDKVRISYEEFNEKFSNYIIEVNRTEQTEVRKRVNVWRPYLKYILDNKKFIVIFLFSSIFLYGITLILSYFMQEIIDRLTNNTLSVNLVLISALLVVAFQTVIRLVQGKSVLYLNNNVDFKFMDDFFSHLLKLPYHFFQSRSSGDILYSASSIRVIRNTLSTEVITSAMNLFFMLFVLIYMFVFSEVIALLCCTLIIIYGLLLLVNTKYLTRFTNNEVMNTSKLHANQNEMIFNIFSVKINGIEGLVYKEWKKKLENFIASVKRKENFSNYIQTSIGAFETLSPLLVIWLGAYLYLQGMLTTGEIVMLYTLSIQLFTICKSLFQLYSSFVTSTMYLSRVHDVLAEEEEKANPNGVRPVLHGNIRLDNVSYKYGKGSVLSGITLQINAGEKVALVGESGSGKSTLAKIIVGLYPPNSGNVYFDGYDSFDIDTKYLKSLIGIVPQEITLFNKTIRENIILHDVEVTEEELEKAAMKANIYEDIMDMPMKFNTLVSESGTNLSGGQKQRIAIARALINNPKFIVFDEATSSLDYKNEKQIDEYLKEIECTRIIISHKLTSIKDADKIIVLKNGQIDACGNHEELIRNNEFYRNYFNLLEYSPGR